MAGLNDIILDTKYKPIYNIILCYNFFLFQFSTTGAGTKQMSMEKIYEDTNGTNFSQYHLSHD